ncbi:DNA-binding transcriptional LysR family regulator [Variovorax boronicumulans]|uniref:DNA-binding transcriptional LysR family regulator n=1 Tax=Variovorax boronicumulans TaxID=436515 RepID=A0AAW8DVI9_9BURK|nr:LysR family transcriptional regulator [Variovorax boronicumulans]MDP9878041.1 DNA-binding transcriptional LysR family regulator [Variovorax boronicumulans]MDP9923324.1 DNA-binding transcriptional LysR family regulator [Variovorax boronicumulans]
MNLFTSLKYLIALDDHRHFGRAALASNVTQPALSNAIRSLEVSYGTAIVKRGRNFGGFTAEGERILASARAILREHELLEQDLNSREGDPAGHLLIGAVPTAMPIAARFAGMLQDRHPRVMPTLRSMSSVELETRLERMAIDMGLGYTERTNFTNSPLRALAQYTEHYFLLRRTSHAGPESLRIGDPIGWAEAAQLPLCLLGSEMHNRTIVDRAFASAGVHPRPCIETNSILTLALSVVAGRVCSVMPGALVGTVRGYGGLEALPLTGPEVEVPIAFMVHDSNRPSRALEAALAFAQDPMWLHEAAQHAGFLGASDPRRVLCAPAVKG